MNFLVCPLDWGLGHATRLVPVIEALLKKGAHVYIGADNRPFAYLKTRFKNCEFVRIPGFVPYYPEKGSMAVRMMKDFGKMKSKAKKAHIHVQEIVKKLNIDVIISDNRYEIYSADTYNVFITHQLNIQTPGISTLFKRFIQWQLNHYIQKFDELWIPDFIGSPNISGKLSHIAKYPLENTHFIGPLSRFSVTQAATEKLNIDILVLLSGPEPQRTLLEELLLNQLKETSFSTVILQGKPEMREDQQIDNVHLITHADDELFAQMVRSARYVISRPGYSTLMDLAVLEVNAAFIPTPGQTEQEYLAESLKNEGIFYSETQKDFNVLKAIEIYDSYSGLKINSDHALLQERIELLTG